MVSIKDIKKEMKKKLSKDRYEHVLNVANRACVLAKIYSEDVKKAKLAGLLHDVTKEISEKEHLKLFAIDEVELTPVEKVSPQLWHAISAPIYVRERFGVQDEEVLNAIRYHTTGRKNMSNFEKIIFVADSTSKEREFPGVKQLRKDSEKNLDMGVFENCKWIIENMASKGKAICEHTFDTYNDIFIKNDVLEWEYQ